MADFGLFGLTVAEHYGGGNAGFMKAAIAAEEIARAEISMAVAVYYLVEVGFILGKYGTSKAKDEILPAIVKGISRYRLNRDGRWL